MDINAVEALTFANRDEFQRKKVAQNLIKLFDSEDLNISPAVIDGQWGSGKTEFCHKLKNLSEEMKSKNKYIYIDAYKYDHTDDPLLMLITSIAAQEKNPEIKSSLLKAAVPVIKVMGKVIGKTAISWLLKQNTEKIGEELANAIDGEADQAIDDGIEKIFKDFEKSEANLKIFQDALAKVSAEVPLVIIIDELDRCKPTFALDLLEKIKHVFSVKDVKFLLSTNLKQMESAVKKQYGYEIDAKSYLNKFFRLITHLPENFSTDQHFFHDNAYALLELKLGADPAFREINNAGGSVMKLFKYLIAKDRRSLRDMEKYYSNLQVYNLLANKLSITEKTIWAYCGLLMLAIYIHTFDVAFKRKLLSNNYSEVDLSEFFGMQKGHLSPENHQYEFEAQLYGLLMLEMQNHWGVVDINSASIKNLQDRLKHTFPYHGQGERLKLVQSAMRVLDFYI